VNAITAPTVGDLLDRKDEQRAVANQHAEAIEYGGGLMEVIARAVRDPSVDIDKMERLFGLHERMVARDAETEYSAAKAAAQAEMPQILRTGKNETTRSSFAELDEIAAKVDPIMAKHGFSMSYGTAESHLDNHYRVTCRLRHKGGFYEDFVADIPSDTVGMKGNQNKTATHGFGSTMSYGRRYLKLLVWDIATTDDDGQAATTGALIDFTNLNTLQARAAQVGATEEDFSAFLKVPGLSHLPAARFTEAMAALSAKERSNAKQRLAK